MLANFFYKLVFFLVSPLVSARIFLGSGCLLTTLSNYSALTGEWSFLEVGSAGECLPQWTCDAPMISGQRMRARIEVIPLEAGYPPLGGFHDTESYMHLPARRCSIHTPRTRWGGKNARCKSLEKSKDNAVLQSPM